MTGIFGGLLAAPNPYFNFLGGLVQDVELSPTTALASVSVQSNGDVTFAGNGPPAAQDWFFPNTTSIGSGYWVRATLNSGSLSGGTTGTWINMTGTTTWTRNRTSLGSAAANITLQVATDSGGANIVASATFDLYAEMA